MFLSKITIEGFMPFKERYEIPLGKGIVGVKGCYGDDFNKSNRAGKTSFIDAIVWVLYGKARSKEVKEIELIHDSAEAAFGSIDLYDPLVDKKFTITRTRTKDNKGSLEVGGFEGSKKKVGQAEIDKLIGLTYDEFLFTAFFKQNDINQFMKADPQTKKQILMRWIQTNNWAVYGSQISEFRKELVKSQTKLKSQMISFEEFSVDPDQLKVELESKLKKKEFLVGEYKKYSDQLVQREIELKQLGSVDQLRAKVKSFDAKIAQLRSSRQDSKEFKQAIDKLETNLKMYPIITDQKFEEASDKLTQLTSAIAQLRAEIRELEKQLDSMASNMTGFCPIIKQSCDRIERNPDEEKKIQNQIRGNEAKIQRYSESVEKCGKVQKLYHAQRGWSSKKETLEEKAKNARAVENQIAELSRDRSELIKTIPLDTEEQKESINQKIYMLKDELSSIDEERTEIDGRLGEIGEALKQHNQKQERLDALKFELAEVEQQLGDAQYVEYMFGKNGIPSMELENSFQEIENDANVILKSLNAPFHLEFEAMRELSDWEPNCLACGTPFEKGERTHICAQCSTPREKRKKDELSLKIYEGGNERPFYLDSGGGQILQSASIRLALTQLARRRKGTMWGAIFLDELFGQLDQTNRKLMADLITSTLIKELGFEQIFMISHDPSIQSSTATNIVARRNQEKQYSELILQ